MHKEGVLSNLVSPEFDQRRLFSGIAMKLGELDHWRSYFKSVDSSVFEIIEYAIMVAALDSPKEFRLRRDQIAQKLYSRQLAQCSGCNVVELVVPEKSNDNDLGDKHEDGGCKSGFDGNRRELGVGGSKESKVNSTRDDNVAMNTNQISKCSLRDAEALTDEIDGEKEIVGEVIRIKEVLDNSQIESDTILFEALRRLQFVALSVEVLQATNIGKSVNALRKSGSKQICELARKLIDEWQVMVGEWVRAMEAIAKGSPDSVNTSDLDAEEGLPSPPLDEGAFFATQTTSIELSKFFDGIDDDGNPRNIGEFSKNDESGRKPLPENHNDIKQKPQLLKEANVPVKDNTGQPMKKQESMAKLRKPPITGTCRPPKPSLEQKVNNESKFKQNFDKPEIQKTPLTAQQDKFKHSNEAGVRVKLEATKRKFQEGYQQADNAKKQRTTQFMDFNDLPKHGLGHKNPHLRPGNHYRHWANGRR